MRSGSHDRPTTSVTRARANTSYLSTGELELERLSEGPTCRQQSLKKQLLRRQRRSCSSPRYLTGTIFFPPFPQPPNLSIPHLRLNLQHYSTAPPLCILPN